MATIPTNNRALQSISVLARLMDSQFRVPGTNMRFGLDAIIGLIPGVGDLSTFAVSGFMVVIMAQNGASGFLLARMILNILIDAIVGAIPLLGDIFDFAFKANTRNMKLMQEHYQEGKHKGSALKVIIPILLLLLIFILVIIWGVYKLITLAYNHLF